MINAIQEQFAANYSGTSRSCKLTVSHFASCDKNILRLCTNPTHSTDSTGWQAFGKPVGTPESNSDKGGSERTIPQGPERAKPCKHADGNLLFCVLHKVPFSTRKLLHHAVAQLLADLDSKTNKTMKALQAKLKNGTELKPSRACEVDGLMTPGQNKSRPWTKEIKG